MTSPQIAPADEAITEAQVRKALSAATIHDLASAADPGYGKADLHPNRFRCPACRRPTAEILDGFRWQCDGCADVDNDPFNSTPWQPRSTVTGQRTVIELRRRVAENFEFAERLVRQGRRASA